MAATSCLIVPMTVDFGRETSIYGHRTCFMCRRTATVAGPTTHGKRSNLWWQQRMDDAGAYARLSASPIGHLATVRPDGAPHIVPVTFAIAGSRVVTAIDHKPKSTARLQRLANIETNPSVSFMVDHYSDDWDQLWWVRVDGEAEIMDAGSVFDSAIGALRDKYHQYRLVTLDGPVISITTDRIRYWESTP